MNRASQVGTTFCTRKLKAWANRLYQSSLRFSPPHFRLDCPESKVPYSRSVEASSGGESIWGKSAIPINLFTKFAFFTQEGGSSGTE